MCGRFTLAIDRSELLAAFPWLSPPEQLVPRFNIAPTQPVLAVPNDAQNQANFFLWGLIPSWAKDPKMGNRMINARAETLADKPAFRAAYKRRRCLIPASGFYEWRKEPGSKSKTPMHIRMKSGQPFAFAGLWEIWHPGDEHLLSCTIITTDANELLTPIHDRMPVILPPDAYEQWLDPQERADGGLRNLLKPYPSDEMEAYPVSTLVNSPANDTPECILPA